VEGFTAKSKKSNKYKEGTVSPEQERIAKTVLDAAFEAHSYLGPGLLESASQT
jgi:hypothetical protein